MIQWGSCFSQDGNLLTLGLGSILVTMVHIYKNCHSASIFPSLFLLPYIVVQYPKSFIDIQDIEHSAKGQR